MNKPYSRDELEQRQDFEAQKKALKSPRREQDAESRDARHRPPLQPDARSSRPGKPV